MSISEKANDLLNKFCGAQYDYVVWSTQDNLVARDKARQEISDRIAELEALVERLIETGKQSMNFTEGFCNNADRDKPEYWHNWNAIVAEYKECEE